MTFEKELTSLINKHSIENVSNTPDFVLAQYICLCLTTFRIITEQRDAWHRSEPQPTKKKTG